MRLRKLITPFVGYGEFRLYQSITDAKALIKKIGATYTTELWANSECSNPVPWTIIRIQNQIHLFFANDKLFKIYLDNGCEGSLSNGIYIGTFFKTNSFSKMISRQPDIGLRTISTIIP